MIAQSRRYKRVELRTRCWCVGSSATLYVTIVNVSAGGLFVKTFTPFRPGESVRVRWTFPGEQCEHEAVAEVNWKREDRDPPGMGLEFTSLCVDTVEALKRLAGDEQPLNKMN